MRSRDGNSYPWLTVLSLIFLSFTTLYADDYLISYRYVVKNSTILNEQLYLSKAMINCDGEESKSIYLDSNHYDTLKEVIFQNRDKFITYLHQIGIQIQNKDVTINNILTSTTILTFKTQCFKVDFNDKFVKISSLK